MDSSEQVPKKIKLSDESEVESKRMIKQLIRNILIKSIVEENKKAIDTVIDSVVEKYANESNYKIDNDLLIKIHRCEAKEEYLESNLNIFNKEKESLLTDDIKQVINKSIDDIKDIIFNH